MSGVIFGLFGGVEEVGVVPPYDRGVFGERDIELSKSILARDDYTCQYCGKRGGNELEVDHIKPLKQIWEEGAYNWTEQERIDWANNPSNLLTACRTCNAQKGSMNPFEWFMVSFTGTKGTGR